MLPPREVHFYIDLTLGAASLSKALYLMALAENKKLKTLLDELLEKWYISLSTSPWGAQVLYVKKSDDRSLLCIH